MQVMLCSQAPASIQQKIHTRLEIPISSPVETLKGSPGKFALVSRSASVKQNSVLAEVKPATVRPGNFDLP
jgi:hypothetical protein